MDRKQQPRLIFSMWIILRSPPMLHSYLQWPPPPSLTTPRHHLHLLNQSPSTSFLSFWHNSSSFPPSYVLNFSTKSGSLKILSCLSIRQSGDHQPTTTTTSQVQQDFRVVFAAGGTGSRIIPAVAIADELKISNPNTQILFIGAPNSMESISIPSAGYPFTFIPLVRLFRPPFSLQNISFPFYLIQSTFHSFKLLQDFDPHIVIGTGGCVSLPICLAAFLKGIKIVIQEQNSVPAMENYILSLFAEVVFVAYNSTVQCFPGKHKCVVSGNPVRLSLRQFVSKDVAMSEFFPRYRGGKEEATVILVLGGSLGANAINIALLHLYGPMLMEHKNWFIIWQTGVEAFNEMESLVKNNTHLVLTPFLHSMDLAYAAADLIVSRAGAMTCSEILATGKPAILIPSPNVAEGNQLKNASLMADVAGSRVITEDELDSITLGMAIEEILGNESLMVEMSGRALQAAKPNASASIAQRILSLLESSNARK